MFRYKQYGLQSSNLNTLNCNTNQPSNSQCANVVPLSKTSNLVTSTNNTSASCRMKYAQTIRTFGTTESSTSYARKTCSIGGPTFSY